MNQSAEVAAPKESRERRYLFLTYAMPLVLALAVIMVAVLVEKGLLVPAVFEQIIPLIVMVCGILAGLTAACGGSLRPGSAASRLGSAVLFFVVGLALYGVAFLAGSMLLGL